LNGFFTDWQFSISGRTDRAETCSLPSTPPGQEDTWCSRGRGPPYCRSPACPGTGDLAPAHLGRGALDTLPVLRTRRGRSSLLTPSASRLGKQRTRASCETLNQQANIVSGTGAALSWLRGGVWFALSLDGDMAVLRSLKADMERRDCGVSLCSRFSPGIFLKDTGENCRNFLLSISVLRRRICHRFLKRRRKSGFMRHARRTSPQGARRAFRF
jgi:hypothetical protein